MIPVKFNYHGDRQEGESLKGQANRIMLILENMMRSGLQQHLIRFIPYDGALIVARKHFGTRTIDIYTGGKEQEVQPKPQVCICNCNISVGWVLEVQEETINGAPLYVVMACNFDGTAYIPYHNVLATDFTPYEVSQKVLLAPYNQMGYLCCVDKVTLPRGCQPIVTEDAVATGTWRTTYRILPYCAMRIPTLLNPEEWNHRG